MTTNNDFQNKCQLLGFAGLLLLTLVSCNNPVSNPAQYVGPPQFLGNGLTVYATTLDGTGALVYPNSGNSWLQLNWQSIFGSTYPAVYDMTSFSNVLYVATANGLLVGSGSTWIQYLPGTKVNAVTISNASGGNRIYASTDAGLEVSLVSSISFPAAVAPSSDPVTAQTLVEPGVLYSATPAGLFFSNNLTAPSFASAASSSYPYTGTLSTIYHDTTNGTFYVGTPTGLSFTTSAPSTAPAWSNLTVANGLLGPVNGVLNVGATVFLATSLGITVSVDNGNTWNDKTASPSIVTGVPVYNIVPGNLAQTYFFSNGLGGVGVLGFNGGIYVQEAQFLSGVNVFKVYVTVP